MKMLSTIAILIGIYAYILYACGLVGFLYPHVVIIVSLLYWGTAVYVLRERFRFAPPTNLARLEKILLSILTVEILVNLIGALGPELAFDALWYHLTFPKLYLLSHTISHIPGGLLYYSDMPKLTELLYLLPLSLGSEILAKLSHLLFGIGTVVVLYQICQRYMSRTFSLLAVLLFYSNLVVGFESITAYIDLATTFFMTLAFALMLEWIERRQKQSLYLSAITLGFAVSTKLLALSAFPLFLGLIIFSAVQMKSGVKELLHHLGIYTILTLLIPSPWIITSYLATGKPFYPFFTDLYQLGSGYGSPSPIPFISDLWTLFVKAPDPISPLYLILLPIVMMALTKKNSVLLITSLYSLGALTIWYFLPRVGGGRFILPYLPVFSFLVMYAVTLVQKNHAYSLIAQSVLGIIIFYAVIFTGYRGYANAKFVPYLVGRESKSEFLSKHLNFSFGDFYDTDGYLGRTIGKGDKALLFGFHNLYYVDFPFVDSSYVKRGEKFNYILTQRTDLPKRFNHWNLLYTNSLSGVSLYGNGGMMWEY